MKRRISWSMKPKTLVVICFVLSLWMLSDNRHLPSGTALAMPSTLQQTCSDGYDGLTRQAAARYGLSSDFLCRIINAEGSPTYPAESRPGAYRAMGVRNLSDPNEVVPAIAKLLSDYLRMFGSERLAAAAFDAGPEAVQKYHDIPPYGATKQFVARVMGTTSDSNQGSVVLKLIDIKADPPCSTWGDITSCAPNGGAITWGPSTNTTYTWTVPPNEIGPSGASITLSVSQSNPSERRVATGLRMTGSGFIFNPKDADVAIGKPGQPLSGSTSVNVKPPNNLSGDYYLKIGVYYGPAFIYHYHAERSSNSSSSTNESTGPPARSSGNEVRVAGLTEDAQYHKAGSAAGAWLPVERGTVLKAGDEITTGPDGSVTLAFADNSTVVLKNATQLKIATFFTEGGIIRTEILLKMGEVASKVNKSEATKSDFRIKTPTDVDSVRGTAFTVRYDPRTQTTTTMVEEGVVEVTPTNTSLRPVTLRAGQQVQVTQNRVGPITGSGNATPAAATVPRVIRECETYQGTICGTWTLRGNQFDAVWQNGAGAMVTIERFDRNAVVLMRRDTNSDFTARYTGRVSGNRIDGSVTWTSQGRSWSGTWNANW
jgi:FecR protein